MALYKYHYIELDTKRSPRISLQNIVAGETGNRMWITVTNNGETVDMAEKENGAWKYRVCLRIDSDLGTRRQDSAEENSGITFIEAQTGDHGKINILLSKDSFTAGMNRAVLEIFSKRVADNDTLICSAEWTFRAAKNPTGENAGTVYPSLIAYENELRQLVSDAGDAIDACEDATDAANDAADAANDSADAANDAADAANEAAETLNTLLDNIDDEPTQGSNHLVKSGGVYSFVSYKVQEAADDLRAQIPEGATSATAEKPKMDGTASSGVSVKWARADHVHPHDTSKQDVLTFDNAPTANSNNPVKSGGIKTAIDNAVTTATKKNLYLVKYTATSWRGEDYIATTTDSAATLNEISADALFASYVTLPSGERVAVYEYNRDGGGFYLRSEIVGEQYVTAYILDGEIGFKLRAADTPIELHVTGTQEVQGTGGQTYRTVTFASGELDKIQTFAKTRDMSFLLQDWRTGMSDMWHVLNKAYVRDDGTNLSVTFTAISPTGIGNEAAGTATGISGMSVIVYFASGVYHSAVATAFSKTF